MKNICFVLTYMLKSILISIPSSVHAENSFSGSIQGIVLDRVTQSPLPMANVTVENTPLGAVTDGEGRFLITGVPVGHYVLRFSYIGYETLRKPDVIVKSDRMVFEEARLKPSAVRMDGVTVRGALFLGFRGFARSARLASPTRKSAALPDPPETSAASS